ncbi:MAG: hypothetical protein CMI26_14360, partial [Opitutae bacterium]|nr:hypothetical protein [Opitutae bacterium]
MSEGLLLQESIPWLLAGWVLSSLWGHQVAVYRAFVDRIRAGASTSSEEVLRKGKLVGRLLGSDNEFRPWSVEAATLSALQITFGFLAFCGLFRGLSGSTTASAAYWLAAAAFLLVLLGERTIIGILGPMVAARPFAAWHMRAAAPAMHAIRLLCKPLRYMLAIKENLLCSIIGKEKETGESEEEVAEHIKTLQEEGSELHPEIREILGNTLDLRNLDVQDALMPRNQIRFLDANDSIEENLALARSCGHTRLPLCDGDLDRCLGIVHVKDIFRLLEEGKEVSAHQGYLPKDEFYESLGKFKLGKTEAYEVAFNQGTDPTYCKAYELFKNTPNGTFIDKLSGAPLFSTKYRFNSKTGWLSFTEAVKDSVTEHM